MKNALARNEGQSVGKVPNEFSSVNSLCECDILALERPIGGLHLEEACANFPWVRKNQSSPTPFFAIGLPTILEESFFLF
jgi:hypothetical protein